MIAAGIGCRRGCPGPEIADLIRAAFDEAGLSREDRTRVVLAAPDRKAGEPGLADAAQSLSLPLRFIGEAALRAVQPRVRTRSARVEAAIGLASVAEAAALAAAGPEARLLLPRRSTPRATCALALSEEPS